MFLFQLGGGVPMEQVRIEHSDVRFLAPPLADCDRQRACRAGGRRVVGPFHGFPADGHDRARWSADGFYYRGGISNRGRGVFATRLGG